MKKVTQKDIDIIENLSLRLYRLRVRLGNEGRDSELNFGNGSILQQLSCAEAALDCILQEF